jgi:wobble nucleotide-excising tRNase
MISNIDYIKNFGVYKNFVWPTTGIQNFKDKNIIYAWNYSGKTTLSRIFSSLRDGVIHPDYVRGSFKLSSDDGTFDINNISQFPYPVLVFNSDYIKENLTWEYNVQTETIVFQVGDDAKNELKINELKNKIVQIEGDGIQNLVGLKEKFRVKVSLYDSFESSLFTDEARRIQNEHFLSLIKFNKGDLKKLIPNSKSELDQFIIQDKKEIVKISSLVRVSDCKDILNEISFTSNINELVLKANKLLESEPEKSIIIDILDKGVEANAWVKNGLKLHQKVSNCFFCDNPISADRFELLNSFYESSSSKLKEQTNDLLKDLSFEKTNIQNFNFQISSNDFNTGFGDDFLLLKGQFQKSIMILINFISNLEKSLKNKLQKNLFSRQNIVPEFEVESINSIIILINNLIKENNLFSENFESIISEKRAIYKNHLVAKFLKTNQYHLKRTNAINALNELEKLDTIVMQHRKEIDRLLSMKNSESEGCMQFNYFVQSFLNRTDIKIEIDPNSKKFNLLRDGLPAINLSEGEKTAISFSHFLVTLKSLEKSNKLKDFILFIDDPISSLDGNHVFQINALLKETLYSKVADPNNPNQEMWVQKCLQIFFSTHNYEFFNLLKELPTSKGFRYDRKPEKRSESRYFISRKLDNSSLVQLPKVYDTFKSEYHYLFKEIIEFSNNPDNQTEKILLMPNVLRRFLEIYTLAKFPSSDEVDDRATEIWGALVSKRICKPFHYFSHFNNIDRIGLHSELLSDVATACNELIIQLKKDKSHFKALQSTL